MLIPGHTDCPRPRERVCYIIRRGFTLETLRFYKFKTKHWLQLVSVMKLFLTTCLSISIKH